MGSRAGVLKLVKPCPAGCGRRCLASADACYSCRRGIAPPGTSRSCATCGRLLRNVRVATRCQSCIRRDQHVSGALAKAYAHRGDRWMSEELDQLRAMAGTYSAKQIGAKIGRSVHAVHVRAHMMGVYLQTDDWTLRRLRMLFGTWEVTIERAWIRGGLLKARKLPAGDHCLRGEWRIREADIEEFIVSCPWAYDAARMVPQSHRLALLAQRVQQRETWIVGAEAIAQRFGLSTAAVQRWCTQGVIPHKRRAVGQGARNGHLVVRERDVERAAEEIRRRRTEARAAIQANLLSTMARRRAAGKQAAAA